MLEKIRAAYHALRLAHDPDRLDHVFALGRAMRTPPATRFLVRLFASTEDGRRALRERPRVAPVDLARLRRSPEGTLGRAYAEYFGHNRLDPEAFLTLASQTSEDFVYAHLFESHDVWHVVTGFDTDLPGEIGLLAFTLAQIHTRPPAALLAAGLAHTAFLGFAEHEARMDALVRGWTLGRSSRSLIGVNWRELFSMPLADVRLRVGLSS